MKLLENKTAIITGASRGIGKGIAQVFAQNGANIAFTYSSSVEAANELEEELNALGVKAKGYQSNAASFEEAQKLAEDVLAEFGSIDVLVNNAGITKDNLLMRMGEEDFDQVIEVNLKSIFNMTKAVQRTMLKQRYGSIINMSSVVGIKGNAGQANYAASKAGIIGFTKSLALETANKGITVNCVAPGYVDTEMIQAVPKEILDKIIKNKIPLGRLGKPEEIAEAVLYLAKDESGFITGTTLNANGGQYNVP